MLEACIRAKQPFVMDNTNPTVKERSQNIWTAKEAGFKIIASTSMICQTGKNEASDFIGRVTRSLPLMEEPQKRQSV